MNNLTPEFKSPLELIEGNREMTLLMENNVNLIYTGVLIRGQKYVQASRFFSSEIYKPKLEEKRIWFFLHIELLTSMKDYRSGKTLAVQRIQKFPRDQELYLVLQYVMWKEWVEARSEIRQSNLTQEGVKDHPEKKDSVSLQTLQGELKNKFKGDFHKPDIFFWKDSQPIDETVFLELGQDSWNAKEYVELIDTLNTHAHFEKWGSLHNMLLEYPGYSLHTYQKGEEYLSLGYKNPSAFAFLVDQMVRPLNGGGDAGNTLFKQEKLKPKRELSSLYTASLLESDEMKDCLSYLSLQHGVSGAFLTDVMGYPLAIGEGTGFHDLDFSLKMIWHFQKLQRESQDEKSFKKQLTFSEDLFYHVEEVEGKPLIIYGDSLGYDSIKHRVEHCAQRIQKILQGEPQRSKPGQWLDLPSVLASSLILIEGENLEFSWEGSKQMGLQKENFIKKLLKWLRKMEKVHFERCIIEMNNGIILMQKAGDYFYIVLIDSNIELGLIKWELNNASAQRNNKG